MNLKGLAQSGYKYLNKPVPRYLGGKHFVWNFKKKPQLMHKASIKVIPTTMKDEEKINGKW